MNDEISPEPQPGGREGASRDGLAAVAIIVLTVLFIVFVVAAIL